MWVGGFRHEVWGLGFRVYCWGSVGIMEKKMETTI